MLQLVPDSANDNHTDQSSDDAIYCVECGQVVTRGRWRLSIDGHEHVFFNPNGNVFRVLCFREAPGLRHQGEPSGDFTWFRGYDWNFAFCGGCGAHTGWRYTATGEQLPPVFFGLIKERLTTTPGGRSA